MPPLGHYVLDVTVLDEHDGISGRGCKGPHPGARATWRGAAWEIKDHFNLTRRRKEMNPKKNLVVSSTLLTGTVLFAACGTAKGTADMINSPGRDN